MHTPNDTLYNMKFKYNRQVSFYLTYSTEGFLKKLVISNGYNVLGNAA